MGFRDDLYDSLQEAVDIKQGRRRPSRVTRVRFLPPPSYQAADIRGIRTKLGMSQAALASLIGVSVKTVEAWETGTNQPSGAAARTLQFCHAHPELAADLIETNVTRP